VVRPAVRTVKQGPTWEEGVAALAEGVELALDLLIQVDTEGAEDQSEGSPGSAQLAQQEVEGRQQLAAMAPWGLGGGLLLPRWPRQGRQEPLEVGTERLTRPARLAEGPERCPPSLLRSIHL